MTVRDIRVVARDTQLSIGYNQQTGVWNVDIPTQADDSYVVSEEAIDYVNNLLITITMVSVAMGKIVKVVCTDKNSLPIPGVQVTPYYRNGSNGSNNGLADAQETGADGIAYLYLQSGSYNLKFFNTNYYTHFINNYQVHSGLTAPYENAGGTIVNSHVVKNNLNAPVVGAFVKFFEVGQDPLVALVANKVTDSSGVWSATLKNFDTTTYIVTFEKPGLEGQKFQVGGVNA